MKFMNALEQAKWHIFSLYVIIIILFFLNLGLVIAWCSTQSNLTIHLPPEIPTSGLTMKAKAYPKSQVFAFAFYIWQSINHWPNNGAKDYQDTIKQLSPYLTPQFKHNLMEDYNTRFNQGELQDRIRMMQGMNGSAFNPKDVLYLGHGTWLVHLQMRLSEYMNTSANVIKDTQVMYNLRVVISQKDANQNQWGLALDGFSSTPKRLNTFI